MKRRHPIDEAFRQGLADRSEATPAHLWDAIDRRRPARRRWWLFLRRHWLQATAALAVPVLIAVLLFPPSTQELGYFPIPDTPRAPRTATLPPVQQLSSHSQPPAPPLQVAGAFVAPPAPAAGRQPTGALPDRIDEAVAAVEPLPVKSAKATPKTRRAELTAAPTLPTAPPAGVAYDAWEAPVRLFEHDPKCARFGRFAWRFDLDAAASPDWNMRRLDARDGEYDSYADARDDTESPYLSFSAMVRFSATSHFGLALRGGLSYSQINERFAYVNETEERITITNQYGPNGEIVGTDTLTETGARIKETTNHYQLVDVPLLVGYELALDKLALEVNGGVFVNMLFRQYGDFLSPADQQPVNFSSDNPNAFPAFHDRVGFAWYGSLGLTYELTPELRLLVEPHLRINPKSFTRDAYPLTQRYTTGGIFIGLRKSI